MFLQCFPTFCLLYVMLGFGVFGLVFLMCSLGSLAGDAQFNEAMGYPMMQQWRVRSNLYRVKLSSITLSAGTALLQCICCVLCLVISVYKCTFSYMDISHTRFDMLVSNYFSFLLVYVVNYSQNPNAFLTLFSSSSSSSSSSSISPGEPGFSKVLKTLSAESSREELLAFLQQYGSHYVSEALYGSELSCNIYFPSKKAQQQLWLQYQKGKAREPVEQGPIPTQRCRI